jgi:hypothetical protein
MRKSVFVVAVIAAACTSVAFAGEIKQDKKATAPAVKATTMSDAQMDKVTAGFSTDNNGLTGGGGLGNGHGQGWFRNNSNGRF